MVWLWSCTQLARILPDRQGVGGNRAERGARNPAALVALGFVGLLALWDAPVALARTWRISQDGTGDAPTIQAAIDSAVAGDVILVGPGRYLENLDFLGKPIVLRSELGPYATTLDGSSRDSSVVIFKRGESREAVLDGFTITGGRGSRTHRNLDHRGGGIFCVHGSPTIRNNIITDNHVDRRPWYSPGGGMLIGTGFYEDGFNAPLIEDNTFERNSSEGNAGALGIKGASTPIIVRNIFRSNECWADGGAIWDFALSRSEELVVKENQFWENVAGDHGGAIYTARSGFTGRVLIENNLFVRNQTLGPGHIGDTGSGGAIAILDVGGILRHNTIVQNDGTHLQPNGGGGLLLYQTEEDFIVEWNLLAFNRESGIACWWEGTATMGPNLLWENEGGDLGSGSGLCPDEWMENLVIADPQFCGAETDNYTVAKGSPAFAGEEVMGTFTEPGCGPGVAIQRSSWGRIKARYH